MELEELEELEAEGAATEELDELVVVGPVEVGQVPTCSSFACSL